MRRSWLLAGFAGLALAGCSTSPTQSPNAPPKQPTRAPPSPVAASPQTYMAQAASIDLLVIRASELALTRSNNPAIRSAANRLMADHRGTSAQLSFAGRRLNLLPSATLLPEHQAMLDDLSGSGDFDRAFIRIQQAVHGQSLALHNAFASRGSSPTLRPVATNAASIERRHLALLRQFR